MKRRLFILPLILLAGCQHHDQQPIRSLAALPGLQAGDNLLTDLVATASSNGWGPAEVNRSNGEKPAGDGKAISVGGRTFPNGFGAHAPSSLTFDLAGRCTTFTASVGVDDEVGDKGSVVFQVYGDGVKLYDSGVLRGTDAAKALSVDLRSRKELKLVVTDAGDGISYDHADWISPTVTGCEPIYSPPLTITRGGTYTGAWASEDAAAAVLIKTSEPVIIENSYLRGRGDLVKGFGVNLTLRNVRGENLALNVAGRAPGRAVLVEEIRNLSVENSSFVRGGIYVRQFKGDAALGQTIRILRNTFSNIDGRQSDGALGYNGKATFRQMVQLNDVKGVQGAEIAWNQVVNRPGESAVEDNINLYASSGTPESPILIHDNYIQGAYPANPASSGYSGGGIMLGDGKVTDPLGNGYARVYGNLIVSTSNYGLAIAGGRRIEAFDNRIVSSGRLPDGTRIPSANVGIYVWDIYGAGTLDPATFGGNVLRDNVSGWTKVGVDEKTSTNPMWLPHCGYKETTCSGNKSLGTVTLASEQAEWTRWHDKLRAAGVSIGAR